MNNGQGNGQAQVQPDVNQQLAQLQANVAGLVAEHFRKLGVQPACGVCRIPMGVCGLPCAAPVLVPTDKGLQMMPQLPAVMVVPIACQRCGSVVYYSMTVIEESAKSPLVRL